jgi:hypothetical protein
VFTYIPSIIFEDKDKEVYMDFLFTGKTGKTLHHNMNAQGITFVHVMEEDVFEFFRRSFSVGKIIHHTAPLIAYFHAKEQITNRNRMFVNLQNTGMDILCFFNDSFLLGNHFSCNSLMDAVYYIFFICKQLKFNHMNDFLHVAGDKEMKRDLIEYLNSYFRHIIPENIFPEASSEQMNIQMIPFEMTCLSLCEL